MNTASLIRFVRLAAALALPWLLAACAGMSWPVLPSDDPAAAKASAEALARIDAARAATDPSYVIGPEDGLDISVWRDETLKASVLVRPDGGISFPLAGDMIVAGKTAAQVRDELMQRLSKYIPDPVVNVSVMRVASYRIYVLGRVNRPGDFQVGRNIDVLQALTLAGGMTPFASEDGIQIIRRIDGVPTSIPFEYSRVRKGADLSQNITLKSGDVLLVP